MFSVEPCFDGPGRQLRICWEDCKTILYRQEDGSWLGEIPSLPGCYALMARRGEALGELSQVFDMLAAEHAEKRIPLPADTSEIVHA